MAFVKQVVLYGLLGRAEPIQFDLKPDVNILFGENGSGKTTVLKVMVAALSNDASSMERLPIDRAEVTLFTLVGRREITYTWDRSEATTPLSRLNNSANAGRGLLSSLLETTSWRSSLPDDKPGKFQHVFLPTTRLYLDDTGRAQLSLLSEKEIDEQFARIINNNWLTYSNEVITRVGEIQNEGLSSVLTYALTDEPMETNGPTLDPAQAYETACRFLSRQSTASASVLGTKATFIERYKSDRKLRWLVDELNKTEEKIERAQLFLRRFISTVGQLFSQGKTISAGSNHLSISLAGGMLVPASALSSGEKHILQILISSMLAKDHVVIIDEPELSLHIDWQRKLVDIISSLNPWCQIIMASHSPEIMANVSDSNIFKV